MNDDQYRDQLATAIVEAVFASAPKLPDGRTELRVQPATEALCHALAIFVSTGATALHDDNWVAAGDAIDASADRVGSLLAMLADRARDGSLAPKARPTLTLVK